NYCEDNGTINDGCRTYPKPVKWEYRTQPERIRIYNHIRDLLRLRHTYDVFTSGTPTLTGGNGLEKQLILRNHPYTASPANADEMNAVVVVNFDVTQKNMSVSFPHAGAWYDYYENGAVVDVAAATATIQLKPGE